MHRETASLTVYPVLYCPFQLISKFFVEFFVNFCMISQVLTFKLIGHTKSILRTTFFYSFFLIEKYLPWPFCPPIKEKTFNHSIYIQNSKLIACLMLQYIRFLPGWSGQKSSGLCMLLGSIVQLVLTGLAKSLLS